MKKKKIFRLKRDSWYVERTVYLIAGIFVFSGSLLALLVDIRFIYFLMLVGGMLMFFSLTGYCPLSIVLRKGGLKRGCV
ncbi:MAG: DUF2892 domain-containing protein [Candidatus Moranbacteria bacterium]|nr:DUF2892 domain-containing protein [Candidatus Moranbacteria bacterium]